MRSVYKHKRHQTLLTVNQDIPVVVFIKWINLSAMR